MAKCEFERGNTRYVPGPLVRFNGILGRFWKRRILSNGGWVLQGTRFHTLRETRSDISNPPNDIQWGEE